MRSARILAPVLAVLFLVCLCAAAHAADTPQYRVKAEFDVKVPMRDGVLLSADVYRPDTAGTFPVILERTPYNNFDPQGGYMWARRGYVCVLMDVRGKYDSDGAFVPFVNEITDGYDSQQWCGAQSWSNGKVGTQGGSYVGATQWLPARLANEHLACMFTVVAASDYYRHWIYEGGAYALSFNSMWGALSVPARVGQDMTAQPIDWDALFRTLPLSDIPKALGRNVPWYGEWLAHPTYDDYWKKLSIAATYDKIRVPAFNMGGWYDVFLQGTLQNFNGLRAKGATEAARSGSRLVIGPWFHGSTGMRRSGQVDFGAEASYDETPVAARWFDYWLKGEQNGLDKDKPVRLYVMGEGAWHDYDAWPPAEAAPGEFFLHAKKGANSLMGDGRLDRRAPAAKERPDTYTYNPDDPVPTLGGNDCCNVSIVTEGPYDQRPVELRNDVLVYTSAPLEKPLTVIGPVSLELWVASSATNTDFTAKLVDVDPAGKAINISSGILRAPFRGGFDRWEELVPGQSTKLTIELTPTANMFQAGHCLRVEVSSSNFPRYDRNLNTPGPDFAGKTEFKLADQTVFHDKEHPSRLILSLMPN
ncbi:CocE/NonD family hydrolase [bacterium]|nr:CocE/NonD family hydrolase [bacterium]